MAVLIAAPLIAADPASRSVAAADPSADIPGVPMPGPVAAGRLGGAVYDVVYRLDVLPGHVIVASLTGTEATDFDLYLFDASATTVLSTAGLLTRSTGPTSSEAISWPARSGGTFYIDLNGATDVEGDYRLTVQTVPDATPPSVALALAGGAPTTNDPVVPVTLAAVDDLSGIAEMAFSTDGVRFGPWLPYLRTTSWTFSAGDGPRFLWAKVRNGVGLESPVTGGSIVIDTVGPSVIGTDPVAGSTVVGLRPTLRVAFDEPINPATWIDLGLIVQSATGALVPGAYSYNVVSREGSFTPSVDLLAGGVYVVTVGEVEDIAGNAVAFPGSWSVTPLTPTRLAATASPTVILGGQSARIDLSLTGAPVPTTLEASSAAGSGTFVPRPAIPTVDGTNVLAVNPTSNTTYRFRYPGTPAVASSQIDIAILVRRSVVLAARDSASVSTARLGRAVNLTAAISPATAGVSVSFRMYRFDTLRRSWVYAGSRGRSTDTSGRATYPWTPSATGSVYWRVAVASTTDFANNTSAVYRWTVRR